MRNNYNDSDVNATNVKDTFHNKPINENDFQHPERELFGMNWLTIMIQIFQRYVKVRTI